MSYKKEWMDSLFYEVVQCWVSISRTIRLAVGPVYNDALYKYCSSIQREE